MKHRLIILGLLLLSSWSFSSAKAQDLSRYHALFIGKFIDYIAWPGKGDDLTIGVVGDSPVLKELQTTVGQRGKGTIKKISEVSDAANCQIIFLPSSQGKLFQQIKDAIADKSVLLVTEEEQFAWQGAGISFYLQDGKLRFLLNQAVASAKNLKISSSLLVLAKVI